jgi:hypothetical protein
MLAILHHQNRGLKKPNPDKEQVEERYKSPQNKGHVIASDD